MGDPIIVRSILPDIVRLRNLGPIGDEIAKKLDALDPTKQQVPPAIQAQVQKLTALVQRLVQERQAKTVEIAGKAQIASMQQQVDLGFKRTTSEGSSWWGLFAGDDPLIRSCGAFIRSASALTPSSVVASFDLR